MSQGKWIQVSWLTSVTKVSTSGRAAGLGVDGGENALGSRSHDAGGAAGVDQIVDDQLARAVRPPRSSECPAGPDPGAHRRPRTPYRSAAPLTRGQTIAAGTRPPRVMAMMPRHGPFSASRQASALASRCNCSHDTGKLRAGQSSDMN